MEIIPTIREDGINAIAFTFKGVLEDIGSEIIEVAMDSTCTLTSARLIPTESWLIINYYQGKPTQLAMSSMVSLEN